jgi:hypothetical protein
MVGEKKMKIFVHKRNNERSLGEEYQSFETLPSVGEFILFGPDSPWFKVEYVVNCPSPYRSEIFVVEVDNSEIKAIQDANTNAAALGHEMPEVAKEKLRLIFSPKDGHWIQEQIGEDECVIDFVELTPKGVIMRYERERIIDALKSALTELEDVM